MMIYKKLWCIFKGSAPVNPEKFYYVPLKEIKKGHAKNQPYQILFAIVTFSPFH